MRTEVSDEYYVSFLGQEAWVWGPPTVMADVKKLTVLS